MFVLFFSTSHVIIGSRVLAAEPVINKWMNYCRGQVLENDIIGLSLVSVKESKLEFTYVNVWSRSSQSVFRIPNMQLENVHWWPPPVFPVLNQFKHYAMKMYGGVDGLDLRILDLSEWSASRPCRFTPREGDRLGSVRRGQEKNIASIRTGTPNISVVQPVASHYTEWVTPDV
jgi:hypothetical protein